MNIFVKTFLVCLVACLGFLFYCMVGENSYSPELKLSQNNVFSSSTKEASNVNEKYESPEELTTKEIEENKIYDKQTQEYNKKTQEQEKPKYYQSCYFFSKNGELIEIKREIKTHPSLENAITLLLRGPMISESKKGIYSEIPPNVDLISVKNNDNSIIINLSSNFGNGGGSQSVENRVKQLNKTVKKYHPSKDVYLYIDGKEVEYLGGEGIYIKQPLE